MDQQRSLSPNTVGLQRSTITERLKEEKENLEERLTLVNKTIQVLESNPNVQVVLDAVAKLNIVY